MHTPAKIHEHYFGEGAPQGGLLFIKRESRLGEYGKLLKNPRPFGKVWPGLAGEYRGLSLGIVAVGVGPSMVGDGVSAMNAPGVVCLYSGTCGGLAEDVQIGDMVVPDSAIAADGFTHMFGVPPYSKVGDTMHLAQRARTFLQDQGHAVHGGTTFTTSSAVAEFIVTDFWKMVPATTTAIEMGGASFLKACERTGKLGAVVLWVTDLPTRGESFFDPDSPAISARKESTYKGMPPLELGLLQELALHD